MPIQPQSDETQLRQLIPLMALYLAIPVDLAFWVSDLLMFPQVKWQLLAVRLSFVAWALCSAYAARVSKPGFRTVERIACFFLAGCSGSVAAFVTLTGGITSPYFFAFNLITIGTVPFLALSRRALTLATIINFAPFLFFALFTIENQVQFQYMFLNGVYMLSMVGIAAVLRTVTFRLRRNETEAIAQLGRVARHVAHDIRSPLTALRAAVSDLGNIPDSHRTLIEHSAKRIEGIADDLLEKHSGTGVKPSDNGTHVSCLVESIVREKKAEFKNRVEIRSVVNLPKDCIARIDQNDLQRALSNLVNNAVDAVGSCKERLITLEANKAEDWIHLSVQDEGPGIPPDLLAKLRENNFSFGKPSGNGLGLNQVRRTAERAAGSFILESTPGKGTRATIVLPVGA